MRTFKRLAAALLTAALAASLLALPAAAAPGSFHDISDAGTAVNADILRLMGVVSGTGDDRFDPSGTLSRAQFCTMVVTVLQKQDDAPRYATRTIFSDVKSSHWARSYVNLAASTMVGDDQEQLPLISGVGDGRFLPDSQITMGEAATILLRALGYSSKQAGAVWPQGYMDLAGSIGLTDGISAGAYSTITRAQAAQLFVNALSCKDAGGKVYYEGLGSVLPQKTIVLAVDVETDDGSAKGAVRTTANKTSEAYLPAHGDGDVPALQGKRGHLVLNDKDEIVTFVPDDSTATTVVLSGNAQPGSVKAAGGKQYTMSSDTMLYTSGATEGKAWTDGYTDLSAGAQITMYSEKGKVVAVYTASGPPTLDSDAVVVMDHATAATFHGLTGGATSFRVMKGRQTITLSQIQPNDVVTYDQISNTLMVSDLRLSCVYQNAEPSIKAPTKISVSGGKEFDVLESAWDSCGSFKPGDSVTLLLTADGKVAGMASPAGKTRSNALGWVEGGSAKMFLPNGGTMDLGSVTNTSLDSCLANLSGTKDGISASRLSQRGGAGTFLVDGMKLGSYTVSTGVRIFEQVSGGAMAPIDRGDLAMESVASERIAGYHLDSSNYVDYIVLDNVTGNAYEYGMMVATTETTGPVYDDEDPDKVVTPGKTTTSWKLIRGEGSPIEFSKATGYSGKSGGMVGVVAGKDRSGSATIQAIIQLTEIKKVKPGDFFESQGVQHVTVNGRTYRVADDVECWRGGSSNRHDKSNWLTGDSRLNSIKSYSDELTIYVDPVGQQVRIVAVS